MMAYGSYQTKQPNRKLPQNDEEKMHRFETFLPEVRSGPYSELNITTVQTRSQRDIHSKSNKAKTRKIGAKQDTWRVGHLDIMRDDSFYGAQTIQCVSVCILLIIARAKRYIIWVVDIKLSYLQSDKPFIRNMFITYPAPKSDLSPQERFELLIPIYSLAESGGQWK